MSSIGITACPAGGCRRRCRRGARPKAAANIHIDLKRNRCVDAASSPGVRLRRFRAAQERGRLLLCRRQCAQRHRTTELQTPFLALKRRETIPRLISRHIGVRSTRVTNGQRLHVHFARLPLHCSLGARSFRLSGLRSASSRAAIPVANEV